MTQIWTRLDYDRPGKQIGNLHLPHSVHRSAYGTLTIPLGIVAGGTGPTVLLSAGTHGDEYEGQIALAKLLRRLEPDAVNGRVIILPMLNAPAARAGMRTSPLDDGNLNRAYPGDPLGGPTSQIAHYVSQVLFPMTDVYQDLHAGGSSLDYAPFVSTRLSGKPALDAKALAAARAFGAPHLLVWSHSPDPRLSTSESNRQDIVSLGGEFGGGGTVARRGVEIVEHGLQRLLAHLGVIEADPAVPPPHRSVEIEVLGRDYYVYAEADGVFEPAVALGAAVAAGDHCGDMHSIDDPARLAVPHHFHHDGIVICQRHQGLAQRGDCLAHLATLRPAG